MAKDGTWGDHVVLFAAANHFQTPIRIISSLDHEIVVQPDHALANTNPLVLGHIHELHYVSLQPRQGKTFLPITNILFFFGLLGIMFAEFIYIQLFSERLSGKMCMQQSQKVIWDMINTWFLTLYLTNLLLLISFTTCRRMFCHSFKFLWKTVNSKPPTIPFGVVACTLSDNLPRNSCISVAEDIARWF